LTLNVGDAKFAVRGDRSVGSEFKAALCSPGRMGPVVKKSIEATDSSRPEPSCRSQHAIRDTRPGLGKRPGCGSGQVLVWKRLWFQGYL